MKKRIIIAMLGTFLVFGILFYKPLMTVAKQDSEIIIQKVNNLSRQPGDPNYLTTYYRLRSFYFAVQPSQKNEVIFLGDSITDDGDWSALFPNSPVENRGIGGDTTTGLLNRLDQIIAQNPSQIFLMIGTNDLCFGRPIPDIIINYRHILHRLQTELPNTKVYIESVLPFNDTIFPSNSLRTNDNIRKLNVELRRLAIEYKYPYVDLATPLTGADGRLPAQYTVDGLHLNNAGYLIWRDHIKNNVSVNINARGF